MSRTFVGFGFGAIQGGLFLYEAFRSGNFDRLVVAEVMPDVVDAVRASGGAYCVNIALPSGVKQQKVNGVEILNSTVSEDSDLLVKAVSEASEIATALPSVDFFSRGTRSVAKLLAEGFILRNESAAEGGCVVYTGENNNFAAEILQKAVESELGDGADVILRNVRFLNTVIGKMSGIVVDPVQIKKSDLDLIVPGMERAFLVEEFNKIFITQIDLPHFERGIDVFVEKEELHPFEEAKLYGHNATHALVGYLANEKDCRTMSEALEDEDLKDFARDAFLNESGKALIEKYSGIDLLFTPSGFEEYVNDLIERMANPYLEDLVERIIRDPERKLGWDDRLIGTMRLALNASIEPVSFAKGAVAALKYYAPDVGYDSYGDVLRGLWKDAPESSDQVDVIIGFILKY